MNVIENYELAVAWCWCYDDHFIRRLRLACTEEKIRLLEITHSNLEESVARLSSGKIRPDLFLDRASDMDEYFYQLNEILSSKNCYIINRRAEWASDKATMTLEFLSHGIHIPYTIILPPLSEIPDIKDIDFSMITKPMVVKPATGGGGEGVYLDVNGIDELQRHRNEYPDDKYLVQEKIIPRVLDGKAGWFRTFFAFGDVMVCRQMDAPRSLRLIGSGDIEASLYSRITEQAIAISRVCGLDLFSTEIALTEADDLIAIDHVNDQCDYRTYPEHSDGVPSEIVDFVCGKIASFAGSYSENYKSD